MGNLTHTVSGGIASFRSAARVPIESLKCHFLPKQDLHGYDKPWPAGGGKNLLNLSATQYSNGSHATSSFGTNNTITIVSNRDNATKNAAAVNFVWTIPDQIKGQDIYVGVSSLTHTNSNHNSVIVFETRDSNNTIIADPTVVNNIINGKIISISSDAVYANIYCRIAQNASTVSIAENDSVTFNNIMINYPSTVKTYSPYENICPIEGWNNITVHKVKKNLFNFDINNVEYNVPNDKGELRSIYHTGIISDGRKISVNAEFIDSEMVGNTTINLGYFKNEVLYQETVLINWETGQGYSKTILVPNGYELLLVNASNSAWGWNRNIPRYNIQIEINNTNTTFEPYYNEIIPITFPNVNKNKFEVTPLSYDDWTGEGYYNGYLDRMNPIINITNKTISITCQGSGDSIIYKKTHYAPGTYTLSYNMTYSGDINTVYKRMVIMCFKDDGTMMTEEDISIPGLTWNKYYKGFFAIAGTFTVPETVDYFTICFGISSDTKGETATFSNIQLEVGSVATAYEPYNYNNSLYGGYIDIATGEIYQTWQYFDLYYYRNYFEWVQEWGVFWIDPNLRTGKPKKMFSSLSNVYPYGGQYNRMPDKTTGYIFYYDIAIRDDSFNGDLASFKASIQEGQYVVYELDTPIFVAKLSSLELQTFINYNNLWSNTNDITEVAYQIHDSNMIKETKKIMATANNSHYKKVIWNQWCYPLNADNWAGYTDDRVSVTFNDEIATSTWLTTDIGYSTSVRLNYNIAPLQTTNDIWYGSYMVNPSKANLKWGIEMCGGQQLTDDIVKPANQWSFCSFVAPVKRNNRNTIYISNVKTTNGSDIGMTAQVKSPIHINLTQMFGAGNEPTIAEFEHLCSLNNIDLTIYHSYDEGTEQYWIFP